MKNELHANFSVENFILAPLLIYIYMCVCVSEQKLARDNLHES